MGDVHVHKRAICQYAGEAPFMFIIHIARHLRHVIEILDSRITKLEEKKSCCCKEELNVEDTQPETPNPSPCCPESGPTTSTPDYPVSSLNQDQEDSNSGDRETAKPGKTAGKVKDKVKKGKGKGSRGEGEGEGEGTKPVKSGLGYMGA